VPNPLHVQFKHETTNRSSHNSKTMITIKSALSVFSVALLLSALSVKAQSCSLSSGRDALTCVNLNGNVASLIDFLKNLDERSLSRIGTVYDYTIESISHCSGIFKTISFLPFLLDCLTSSPIFKCCECLSRCVFTVIAIFPTISYLLFPLDCLTSSRIFKGCKFCLDMYSLF